MDKDHYFTDIFFSLFVGNYKTTKQTVQYALNKNTNAIVMYAHRLFLPVTDEHIFKATMAFQSSLLRTRTEILNYEATIRRSAIFYYWFYVQCISVWNHKAFCPHFRLSI